MTSFAAAESSFQQDEDSSSSEAMEVSLDTEFYTTTTTTKEGSELDMEASTDADSDNSLSKTSDGSLDDNLDKNSLLRKVVGFVKQIFSGALLIFSIYVVAAAMYQKQTTATGDQSLSPTAAFIIFWAMLLYLAQLEGGLNVMVGLKPVKRDLYEHSHPHVYGETGLVYKNGNLDRFIVGRQYLDLTMVFTTNFMVSAIDGASIINLPKAVSGIFLDLGIAVILVTIIVGQLVAVINSTRCMLDYVNNYVMLISTYIALGVEASGILHAVYFVQFVASHVAGKVSGTTKAKHEKTRIETFTFWLRVVFSLSLLGFAIVVTGKALFDGDTTMWEGVPAYASVIILVVLILVAGVMESLQIAFMAVLHMSEDEIAHHPVAKANMDYIFARKNRLQAFLIGRQVLQTVIMFVIARITSLDMKDGKTIFGVSSSFQTFLNSGVLAILFATIIASLSWRVLANTFPVAFLSCPLSRPIIFLCLAAEATGICSIAWSLAKIHRVVCRLKDDEYYIGSIEERAVDNNSNAIKELDITERTSVHQGCDNTDVVLPIAEV